MKQGMFQLRVPIKTTGLATDEEWDEIWRNCDYATICQSREWCEILDTYYKRNQTKPRLIVFSDGKKAVLPIYQEQCLMGFWKESVFKGWISNDDLGREHAVTLARYLIRSCGRLTWCLSPFDGLSEKINIPSVEHRDEEAHVVYLSDGMEEVFKRWSKGHRSSTKKAIKEGVTVRLAATEDDWKKYFEIYEKTLRRWGDSTQVRYRWDLFEQFYKRHSPFIKLWLAEYQNVAICGAICLYAKRHAIYWHGASCDEFMHLRPMNLIMYMAMKDACEKGFPLFDLGSSTGLPGVGEFKRRMGAEIIKYPIKMTENLTFKWADFLKRILKKRK